MADLSTVDGRSLNVNLGGLFDKTVAGFKQAEVDRLAKEKLARVKEFGEIIADPSDEADTKEKQAALVRLSVIDPTVAEAVRATLKSGDERAIKRAAFEAERGLKDAFAMNKGKTTADKKKIWLDILETRSAKGESILQGLDMHDLPDDEFEARIERMIIAGTDIKTLTEPPKAPAKRERVEGNDLVIEEFDRATGKFKEVSRGPRFKPDPTKAPETRERIEGDQLVVDQFNPATNKFEEVSRGPRFKTETEGPFTDAGKLFRDRKNGDIDQKTFEKQMKALGGGGLSLAKINPKDFTPESFDAAFKANDPTLLREAPKEPAPALSPERFKQEKDLVDIKSQADISKAISVAVAIEEFKGKTPTAKLQRQILEGKVAQLEINKKKKQMRADAKDAKAFVLEGKVDEAIALSNKWFTTGFLGNLLSSIGGTDARNLRATIDTIQANLGFAELQAMRDASPTGGALGQVAVRELDLLQATVASLDQGQDDEQLIANLGKVREHIQNWKKAVNDSKTQGGTEGGGELSPEQKQRLQDLRNKQRGQ